MQVCNDEINRSQTNVVTRNRSLAHTGKLGMKWGHHTSTIKNVKFTSSDGGNSSSKINSNTVGATARAGQSAATLGQTINKNTYSKKALNDAKKLSDDDLKKLTNRLNLENNYMNATTQQQGRGKVESLLSTAGATLAVVSSAAIMVEAIKKAKG